MQADKPDEWLGELKRAVVGNSALMERLDSFLNPMKSQSTLEWEERQSRREKKRKKEDEERDRSRAEWVEHLKATPDVVRHPPGLRLGEFSKDQYWLLAEIENEGLRTSRVGGANWKALVAEFGEDVARAYREQRYRIGETLLPASGPRVTTPLRYPIC